MTANIQTVRMTPSQFTALCGLITERPSYLAVKDFADRDQSEEVLCKIDDAFAFKGRRVGECWHVAYDSEIIAPQNLRDKKDT